jgi:hypothetical protein
MKKILSIGIALLLGLGLSMPAFAQGNSQSSEMLIEKFNVNGKNVDVKISKENRQKVTKEVLRGLAEEFPDGVITVHRVGDLVKEDHSKKSEHPDPNHHKVSNQKGEFSPQTSECSYYTGLCNPHSHYYVSNSWKTSYGNRGPSRFLIAVARGAEKSFTSTHTETQSSSVSGGVSGIRSEVSASINASVSETWSTTFKFSGISPEIVLPKNTREFYWAGLYDYGKWTGYEDYYDRYGGKTRYYYDGTFKEYVRDIEWSVDKQY